MAQHLSVRVPWKDNGYSGLVCNKPCYNNACLRLSNIADSRNDELEDPFTVVPYSVMKQIFRACQRAAVSCPLTHIKRLRFIHIKKGTAGLTVIFSKPT
jgi:hypothetical protein